MSRDNGSLSDEALRAALDELRRALHAGEDPPGFERLLGALALQDESDRRSHPVSAGPSDDGEDTDDMMLAVLIGDALDGVDIARRYPHAFKLMLVDAQLRAAFLDGLRALENAADEGLELLPLPPSHDLTFLDRVRRSAPQPGPGAPVLWPARWRRSANDLAALFSFLLPPLSGPGRLADARGVYRSGGDFLEDETVTLLRGRVAGSKFELDVTLEATRPASQPDELHLTLWVLPVDETAHSLSALSLQAHVKWGDYEAQVEIVSDGEYILPPLKLHDVVDASQTITGDLHITLQQKR